MNHENQRRASSMESPHKSMPFGRILFSVFLTFLTPASMGRWVSPSDAESRGGGPRERIAGVQDIRPLQLGKTIQREIGGGKSHFYQLAVRADEYVLVKLRQLGADFMLILYGPDQKVIVRVDISDATEPLEPLSLIAEVSGMCLLEVRSLERGSAPCGYEVELREQRPATVEDRSRATAERAYMIGMHLRRQVDQESQRRSLEEFAKAGRAWHAAGFPYSEAEAFLLMGEAYFNLSDYPRAMETYNQAMPILQRIGNRGGEAWALSNIGRVHTSLGETQMALECHLKALELYRSADDSRGIAIASTHLGATYDLLGEKQTALDYLEKALPFWRSQNDPKGEARALHSIGAVYASLGELQEAIRFYRKALPLWGEEFLRKAGTINNLGGVHAALGANEKALEFFSRALLLRQEIGDIRGQANTFNSLGQLYHSMGEKRKAVESCSKALPLFRSLSDRAGEADTLTNICSGYRALGDSRKALDFCQKAVSLRRAVGDREAEANTLYNLARAENDLGDLSGALAHIEEALKLPEYVRTSISVEDLRVSYFSRVRHYYDFYIDLLGRMSVLSPSSGYDSKALEASERARARSLLEALADTRTSIREDATPELLERERSLQQHLKQNSEYFAQCLRSNIRPDQYADLQKKISDLYSELEAVRAEIRASSPRYAALTQPQPFNLAEIQQEVLDCDSLLLEYFLGDEHSYVWAVTSTSIAMLKLPRRVEIERLARRVYESLTVRNRGVSGETPESRRARLSQAEADYAASSSKLSQILLGCVADKLGTKRLLIVSEGVLQYIPFAALPVPRANQPTMSNVQQQNGQVGSAPIALVRPKPLIVDHEIVNLPSASILAVVRRELASRTPSLKTIAVLADPVFSRSDPRVRTGRQPEIESKATPSSSRSLASVPFLAPDLLRSAKEVGFTNPAQQIPRLPSTRKEASAIASFVAAEDCKQALDFEANRVTATSAELSQYRIVHFATHGLLNSNHPELSGLILSLVDAQGRPQDGFLRLHDIYNLRLPADLIVLSACQTGLGKDIKGEGLIGLTRGFMAAGVARVLASLWKVDDASTAELMKRFYQGMLEEQHLSPAAALRAAQISMWKQERWRSPYYWAAFILQGEWR